MKVTPFNSIHKALKAKMVEFAGFEMPIEYSGIINEHLAVRNNVGVFDVSHMGEIWVKGPQARDFVQYVSSNDIDTIKPGQCQYSCLPNESGGIVDDLIIYYYQENKYLLVVNASNIEKDYQHLVKNNKFNCEIENNSDNISQLAVQGPNAIHVLNKLFDVNLSDIKPFHFVISRIKNSDDIIVSNTGYTGAGGFELYFYNKDADNIWNQVMKAGEEFQIQPIGLAARDTLRLEMGYCLYGNDIDDKTSPIEAGLGWITKLNKSENFISKELFIKQKQQGTAYKLSGFVCNERGIPRHDYSLVNSNGDTIGRVTSGTNSPVLKQGVGLAYLKTEYSKPGTEIFVQIRNKRIAAKVKKPPFV